MRNPFKRQPRPADKLTLRERMAATREKFGLTVRVHRALNAPAPAAEPAVERAALVNYATWLHMERRLVCNELYPHLGSKAAHFVVCAQGADQFHYPLHGSWQDVPPPSTRALKVLDQFGVNWRLDREDFNEGDSVGPDDGQRPPVPYGWPAVDAPLTSALAELQMLDAAIAALMKGHGRDPEDVPGYSDLDDAREAAIDAPEMTRAEGMPGLQAKAAALFARSITGCGEDTGRIARSLARDLMATPARKIEARPDPVFAAIEEAHRLTREWARLFAISSGLPETDASAQATAASHSAMWDHVRGVLLKTVPTTAAGCVALAQFAREFTEDQGVPLEYESNDPVLALIARSPAL